MITLFFNDLEKKIKDYFPFKEIVKNLNKLNYPITVEGPKGPFLAYLIGKIAEYSPGNLLIVLPTEKEANNLSQDLEAFNLDAFQFPWWGSLPYQIPPNNLHISGERINKLIKLQTSKKNIIIASLRSLLTPVPPPDFIKNLSKTIKVEQTIDPKEIETYLGEIGYLRVPRVSAPGEFALRGEVLDIFLPGNEEALRIVFEFDVVEEIKLFSPISQKSTENFKTCTIFPAKEIIWTEDRIQGFKKYLKSQKFLLEKDEENLDKLTSTNECTYQEMFFPITFEKNHSIIDYLSEDSLLTLFENERIVTG